MELLAIAAVIAFAWVVFYAADPGDPTDGVCEHGNTVPDPDCGCGC
jgi:hypothetical protein